MILSCICKYSVLSIPSSFKQISRVNGELTGRVSSLHFIAAQYSLNLSSLLERLHNMQKIMRSFYFKVWFFSLQDMALDYFGMETWIRIGSQMVPNRTLWTSNSGAIASDFWCSFHESIDPQTFADKRLILTALLSTLTIKLMRVIHLANCPFVLEIIYMI